MGSQRVGHDWATELNWTDKSVHIRLLSFKFVCVCVHQFVWIPISPREPLCQVTSPWRWPTSHPRTAWKISQGFVLWLQHSSSSPSSKSFFLPLLFTMICSNPNRPSVHLHQYAIRVYHEGKWISRHPPTTVLMSLPWPWVHVSVPSHISRVPPKFTVC